MADEDRRKRLKTMKARKDAVEAGEKPVLKFRNYQPQTEALKEHKLAPVELPAVEEAVEEVLAQGAAVGGEGGALNIAPKKPDWDLKRDVQKRTAKLHKRTQRAIVELIRRRLEEEAQEASSGGEEEEAE